MTPFLTKITDFLSPPQSLSDKEFLEKEIAAWKSSPERAMQIKGAMYYSGDHDILKRKRTVIGERGEREEITNLPNNRAVYNLYGKLVTQKANYLLGKPFVLQGDNAKYINALKEVFDRSFMRVLKNAGKAALNGGIAWLYVYYDNENTLKFRLFPAYEILPFWKDNDHTEAEAAVRLYRVEVYEGKTRTLKEKVELYTLCGVQRFTLSDGVLIPDIDADNRICRFPYAVRSGQGKKGTAYSWKKLPLIPIKYGESEIPLLKKVKSLQDGLNLMLSDFENNMQEDARNTILVLKNYDGTNLGEFRKNLAAYGAVKVRCDRDAQGGVETLEVQVNSDNYKAIIGVLKEGIIENAMGFSSRERGLNSAGSGFENPNQLNVKSMYTDIDLDANDMETELQAAFRRLLPFADTYLFTSGKGDFQNEEVDIIFNRDMLINETEAIANCINSLELLSRETAVAQHPWVNDPQAELKRLKAQNARESAADGLRKNSLKESKKSNAKGNENDTE